MSLTFLHPLFLFGLAAGILPILIHRLTKRNALVRKFSAVRLLLQSQRQMARPQRLKHLLLLILRILAVMSLAFLMARPVLSRQGLLVRAGGAKAVILDNSLSMGYQDERGRRYDLAKRAVREAIEDLKGQVLIIPEAPVRGKSATAEDLRWMRPDEAIKELAAIPLSFDRGDPTAALTLAYLKLKDLKVPKEILIVSDMARGDWEGFNLGKLGVVSAEAGISFLRIGGPDRDPNFAIKGARLAEGDAVVGVPTRLEVTVSNLSDKPGTIIAQLYLSGIKKDQKSMDLSAGEDGKTHFELFLDKAGWVDGEIRLASDRLSSDDLFYFSLKVREKVRVLIVDGDPRPALKAGESHYVVNALAPGGSDGSLFLTKVITEGEMAGTDVRVYDTLFLLNVSRPEGSKLASFIESGKPIFIFLGDRVVPEAYHPLSFFPWRMREVKTDAGRGVKIARVDENDEALMPFAGAGGGSLRSALFQTYFRVEGNTKNLLTLENNDPLLSVHGLEKGKIFLYASSADLDWNDLPLKTAYLPLIQGLLKEALGLTRDFPGATIRLGKDFAEKGGFVQRVGPQGGPGIYNLTSQSGEIRHGVNPPLEESDLGKMKEAEIKERFGRLDVRVVEYHGDAGDTVYGTRKELWPFFLGFLLLILSVEMLVANGIRPSGFEKQPGER